MAVDRPRGQFLGDQLHFYQPADNIMFPPGPAQQPDKERYAILYSAAKHTEARSWALAAMDPVLKALLGFDAAADFTVEQARKVISLYLEHNKNEAGGTTAVTPTPRPD